MDKYVHIVAKLKSLENKMFSKNQIMQLAEGDFNYIARILADANYGDVNKKTPAKLYMDKMNELKEMIFKLLPDEEFLKIYFSKFDFYNVKLFVKLGKTDFDFVFEIKPDDLKLFLEKGDNHFSEPFNTVIPEAMKIKENSLFEAESYIDKAMFKHLLTLKNDFWQGYVRNWIDFVNLRTILRCKFFDMSRDMFENMIIDGGYVDKGRLLRAFSENYENISKHFRISDLSKVFDRLMESYIKDKDFSKLEREIDNALMEYLKKSKLYALSLENLIAYVVAYESELKNVKFIIEGKRNNVSEEAIKERLRETYV